MKKKKESISAVDAIKIGALTGPVVGILSLIYNQLLWEICRWLGFARDGGYDSLMAMMFSTEQLVIAGVSMLLAASTIFLLYLMYVRKMSVN